MIKEKHKLLFLSRQIKEITTIANTGTSCVRHSEHPANCIEKIR